MSLAQAVLDVAAEMDEVAKDAVGTGCPLLLRSFARELRTAVKAAERDVAPVPSQGVPGGIVLPSHSRPGVPQEDGGERMAECVGGSFNGDMVPVPANVPVGAYLPVADAEVYRLDAGGKLTFSATQTQRYLQARGQ